jgi:Family of unknown function (DUF5758)
MNAAIDIKTVLDKHMKWLRGEPKGERADLSSADLSSAEGLGDPYLKKQQIVPEVGPFTGFKKLADGIVAQLEIIGSRVGGVSGRKCRTAEATVIAFFNADETPILDRAEATSLYSAGFKYRLGETVKPVEEFNASMVEECGSGIHFFLSFSEAASFEL